MFFIKCCHCCVIYKPSPARSAENETERKLVPLSPSPFLKPPRLSAGLASPPLLQGPDPRGQRPEAQRLLLGKVGQDLAVERDVLCFQSGDEGRVRELKEVDFFFGRGERRNPKPSDDGRLLIITNQIRALSLSNAPTSFRAEQDSIHTKVEEK